MTQTNTIDEIVSQPYKYGFITDIETEKIPKGLNEDVIRLISAKKNEPEFLLKFRLRAYKQWLKMKEPDWSGLRYSKIDYQDLVSSPTSLCLTKQFLLSNTNSIGSSIVRI